MAIYTQDDNKYLLTKRFFEDAATHQLADGSNNTDSLDITCPVHLLHGMQDPVVPYQNSVELASRIWSNNVQVVFSKASDHHFSQPDDIQLLFETVDLLTFGQPDIRDLAINSWSAFSSYPVAPDTLASRPKVIRKY